MVTPEQRAAMYGWYAPDPRMRANVGIRRRLSPLLDNSRAEIELIHALLLSLPGSPCLYYGDEIGMGDNIWLNDRDAVRTPMQWTPDRNAGFSAADPGKLYLPVVSVARLPLQQRQRRGPDGLQLLAAALGAGDAPDPQAPPGLRAAATSRSAPPTTTRSCPSCGSSGRTRATPRSAEAVLCVNNLASPPAGRDDPGADEFAGRAARGPLRRSRLPEDLRRRHHHPDPRLPRLLLAAAGARCSAWLRSTTPPSSPTKIELVWPGGWRASAGMPPRAGCRRCARSGRGGSTTPPARWASRPCSSPTRAGPEPVALPGPPHLPRRAARGRPARARRHHGAQRARASAGSTTAPTTPSTPPSCSRWSSSRPRPRPAAFRTPPSRPSCPSATRRGRPRPLLKSRRRCCPASSPTPRSSSTAPTRTARRNR